MWQLAVKYVIEGFAVALAAYIITGARRPITEVLLIGLSAAATFMVLDLFARDVAQGARQGTGFRFGLQQVGFGRAKKSGPGQDKGPGPVAMPEPAPFAVDTDRVELGQRQASQVMSVPETPYRYEDIQCPQKVVGGTVSLPMGTKTEGVSRWTKWDMSGKPVNHNTNEYKLVPGQYAKLNLQSGYNEPIGTFNAAKTADLAAVESASSQSGGFCGGSCSFQTGGGSCQTGTGVGVEEGFESASNTRLSGVVYSGDILNIMSGEAVMQRGVVNSQIIFDKPLPEVKTNLSKLRLVIADKRGYRTQTPIRYGDSVFIRHNAMSNNSNQSKFIKYGDRLQSHQDGSLFRVYKLFNKNNPMSRDPIKYGEELVIARGDQSGDNIYLRVEADKSVSSESPSTNATPFVLSLERVYELFDRNLCVCPGETIYP